MVSLTVELSREDLAALQDYAAAHPETGGLAGALEVAVALLRERRAAEARAQAAPPPAGAAALAPSGPAVPVSGPQPSPHPATHPPSHVVRRHPTDHAPLTPSWDRGIGQGLSA